MLSDHLSDHLYDSAIRRQGYRYTHATSIVYGWRGSRVRVTIAGDVIAITGAYTWALDGFGRHVTVDWLLHSGDLPGPEEARRALAHLVVDAVRQHHRRQRPNGGAA